MSNFFDSQLEQIQLAIKSQETPLIGGITASEVELEEVVESPYDWSDDEFATTGMTQDDIERAKGPRG